MRVKGRYKCRKALERNGQGLGQHVLLHPIVGIANYHIRVQVDEPVGEGQVGLENVELILWCQAVKLRCIEDINDVAMTPRHHVVSAILQS